MNFLFPYFTTQRALNFPLGTNPAFLNWAKLKWFCAIISISKSCFSDLFSQLSLQLASNLICYLLSSVCMSPEFHQPALKFYWQITILYYDHYIVYLGCNNEGDGLQDCWDFIDLRHLPSYVSLRYYSSSWDDWKRASLQRLPQ